MNIKENNLHHYKAIVKRIVDGDTAELAIDLGFTITWTSTCRFYGINAPELSSDDVNVKHKAEQSKQYLIDNLSIGCEVIVISRKLDKYGRPVVDVYLGDRHINQEILDKGLAIKYLANE